MIRVCLFWLATIGMATVANAESINTKDWDLAGVKLYMAPDTAYQSILDKYGTDIADIKILKDAYGYVKKKPISGPKPFG